MFSILLNFGMNDRISNKIVLFQYLKKWKEFAQQDRKILKLMMKAQKYHSRKQKAKIWKAWIQSGLNTEIYQKYASKLMSQGMQSLKKYIFRRKVKNIKTLKWQKFLKANLQRKYFDVILEGIQVLSVENREIRTKMKTSNKFRGYRLQKKTFDGLKKFCYRARVTRYVEQVRGFNTRQKIFKTMVDEYYSLKTMHFRERQIMNYHFNRVGSLCFNKLKTYYMIRLSKKFKTAKAVRHRQMRLASLSVMLLGFYKNHKQ